MRTRWTKSRSDGWFWWLVTALTVWTLCAVAVYQCEACGGLTFTEYADAAAAKTDEQLMLAWFEFVACELEREQGDEEILSFDEIFNFDKEVRK